MKMLVHSTSTTSCAGSLTPGWTTTVTHQNLCTPTPSVTLCWSLKTVIPEETWIHVSKAPTYIHKALVRWPLHTGAGVHYYTEYAVLGRVAGVWHTGIGGTVLPYADYTPVVVPDTDHTAYVELSFPQATRPGSCP